MTKINNISFNDAPAFEGDGRHKAMIDFYRQAVQLTELGGADNPQMRYYKSLLDCARPVRVVSASEVWSPDEVKQLRDSIRPAKKECYRTAALLTIATNGEARYVEGQMWTVCLGVDHAFNYIPSKGVCVDFTAEFALGRKPEDGAYIGFKDFSYSQLWNIIQKNGYYGNIYNEVFFLNK